MGTFGGRGKRPNRPASAGEQGEIYIKGFPKDTDRMLFWILDPNPPYVEDNNGDKVCQWFNFEQHFDPTAKRSWPCAIAEDAANCVGCEFPVEDPTNENDRGLSIRSTGSQYILPIVDEKGYVSLFQFGWGIYQGLISAFDEYGKLNDAWYAIRKSKVGQKITYSVTKTDNRQKPEVKVPVPDEEYISHSLGKRYLEAMERYGYSPDEGKSFADVEAGDTVGDGDKQDVAGETEGQVPDGDKGETTEPTPEPSGDTTPQDWDPNLNAREASVGELKDWLDNIPADGKFGGPKEYPKKPSRPVLVGLVEKAQADFPPF